MLAWLYGRGLYREVVLQLQFERLKGGSHTRSHLGVRLRGFYKEFCDPL